MAISGPMSGTKPYAYSFNRESFRGEFATREHAADAGLRDAEAWTGTVHAVYVGKRVAVDAQTDHHAEGVVRAMRQRFASKTSDSSYLAEANEHLLADLDASLKGAIDRWLAKYELTPPPTIASISEHPLLAVRAHAPARDDEVHSIGPEE